MILTLQLRRKILQFLFSTFEGENTNTTKGRSSENSTSIHNLLQWDHQSPSLPLKTESYSCITKDKTFTMRITWNICKVLKQDTQLRATICIYKKKAVFPLLWCAKWEVTKTVTSKVPYSLKDLQLCSPLDKDSSSQHSQVAGTTWKPSVLSKTLEPPVRKNTNPTWACCPWNISCHNVLPPLFNALFWICRLL